MATVEQVFAALQRVDPDSARVLAAATVWQAYEDTFEDVMKSEGPRMVAALEHRINQWRARAGGEYVAAIAKSADPAQAAAATSRLTAAIADAEAVREALLLEISKAGEATEMWQSQGGLVQRRVKRDAKGRFVRTINPTVTSDIGAWRAPDAKENHRQRVLPATVLPRTVVDNGVTRFDPNLSDSEREDTKRYLGQIKAVDDLRRELRSAFGREAEDMLDVKIIRDAPGGGFEQALPVPMSGDSFDEFAPDMGGPQIKRVEYGPKAGLDEQKANRVRAQLMYNEMPGMQNIPVGADVVSQLANVLNAGTVEGGKEFDESKTSRLAGLAGATSGLLRAIPTGATQNAADSLAEIQRGLDSQAAEKMKIPMTRAAYRLRGTTKEPDAQLVATVSGQRLSPGDQQLVDQVLGQGESPDSAKRAVEQKYRPQLKQLESDRASWALDHRDPAHPKGKRVPAGAYAAKLKAFHAEMARAERGEVDVVPIDQLEASQSRSEVANALIARLRAGQEGVEAVQGAQRDVAAYHFLNSMVEREAGMNAEAGRVDIAELSDRIAANVGRGFPSEGVIIDAKGKVATQAVGMGEDHYLPFDLANYKSMSNGSYVRTRSLGGLTSEDMRSMLLGNARAATVVSGSGVFEIELDPKLKGGRRYNDKVARIPEMYDRILDEIAEGGHYAIDLDPQQRQKLDIQLGRWRSANPGADKTAITAKKDELKAKLRAESMALTQADVDEAKAQTAAWAKEFKIAEGSEKFIRQERKALREIRAQKVRELSINGEGYDVAMKTLQRYFPYYIKSATYRPLERLAAEVKGVEDDTPTANAVTTSAKDRWRVRPGDTWAQTGNKPMTLASRRKTDSDERTSVSETPAAAGAAAGAAQAAANTGEQAADTKQREPSVTDIGGDEKVTAAIASEWPSAPKKFADKLWKLRSPMAPDLNVLRAELTQGDLDADPARALFDPNLMDSQAGLALVVALMSPDKEIAQEAVRTLGSSQELRDKVASEESKNQLTSRLGVGDALDKDGKFVNIADTIRGNVDDAVKEIVTASMFLANDWAQTSGDFAADLLANGGQPLALPELAVDNLEDIQPYIKGDEPLAGFSGDVREAAMGDNKTTPQLMGERAVQMAQFATEWNKTAPGLLGEDDTATKLRELKESLAEGKDPHLGQDMLKAFARLAKEQGVDLENGAATLTDLASNPGLVMDVANAAAVEYSLSVRDAQMEWGSNPKVEAAFRAATAPAQPVQTKEQPKPRSLPWEVHKGRRSLVDRILGL